MFSPCRMGNSIYSSYFNNFMSVENRRAVVSTQDVKITRAHFNLPTHSPVSPNLFARVAATLNRWHVRARQRSELASLDQTLVEILRRDVGVSNADIWREANKPFWRE